jgi:hypothetical protein
MIATSIGYSGYDFTYSCKYVYLVDWLYHSISNCSYYDVLLVFPYSLLTKREMIEILRFNATYINQFNNVIALYQIIQETAPSLSNYPKILSCQLPVNTFGNGTLTNDGIYKFLYPASYLVAGVQYPLTLFPFKIENLTTTSPAFEYNYVDTGYIPNNWNPQGFYYMSSIDVAGYVSPFSNVIFEIDYAGYVISDLTSYLNAQFSYLYDLTPSSTSKTGDAFTCYQAEQHLYTGYIYYNNIQAGNGTFILRSTGLGIGNNIYSVGTYTQVANGIVINGILKFYLAPRDNPSTCFEGLKLEVTLTNFAFTKQHFVTWIRKTGLPSSSGGNEGYGAFDLTWFMIIFLAVFAPTIVLGVYLGIAGFVGGLIMGLGISIATGLLPFYTIVFVGIAVLIIFFLWRK